MTVTELVPCTIEAEEIQRDDRHKELVRGNTIIKFRPTEYKIISLFFKNWVRSDKEIIKVAFGYEGNIDDTLRRSMEAHLDGAKLKLKCLGLYFSRVYRYGYALMHIQEEEENH